MFNKIFPLFLVLILATMACGLQVDLPSAKSPGKDIEEKISIPYPVQDVHLVLSFGGGKLILAPGAANLVEGTATYNLPDFKPEIKTTGGAVNLSQGNYKVNGLPVFNGIKNIWDLKLGAKPMYLAIKAGGYQGSFNFGGLSLTELTIDDGAADVTADFSKPNPEKLALFSYKTGASNVTLNNLANANFSNLTFESGAGNYKLDFGGSLLRDGTVTIRSGMSNLSLIIPQGVNAVVKVTGGLSNLQVPAGWEKNGDTYSQTGSGPALTIMVEMGAGNVQISE